MRFGKIWARSDSKQKFTSSRLARLEDLLFGPEKMGSTQLYVALFFDSIVLLVVHQSSANESGHFLNTDGIHANSRPTKRSML